MNHLATTKATRWMRRVGPARFEGLFCESVGREEILVEFGLGCRCQTNLCVNISVSLLGLETDLGPSVGFASVSE